MKPKHRRTAQRPRHSGNQMDGMRLDKRVKELFDIPWSAARKRIETGKVQVNGERVVDLAHPVGDTDRIEYFESAPRPLPAGAFDPRCIVFQDAHIVVAAKPADVLTVPFETGDKDTFDQQLRGHLKKVMSRGRAGGAKMPSVQVVHRLDRKTSGLLVFPLSFKAKEGLAVQFREHSVQREYKALVHGVARAGTITSHLMKDRGDGIRGSFEASRHKGGNRARQGQLAITHVAVLEKLDGASLVSCRLETGRTNQIRIHMAEQGCPLVGERTYMRDFEGTPIPSDKLMLHAETLGFVHPLTGKKLSFQVDPPGHFTEMHRSLSSADR